MKKSFLFFIVVILIFCSFAGCQDNSTRYWIITSYDHTKSIRKCYLSISLEEGHESIWLYYDASGNLYYISYHNNSEYIDGKNTVRESIILYVDGGIIVGGEDYQNAEFDSTIESRFEEWDRFLKSLYGSKVDKTPYLKKDLSPFLNTKNLKKYLDSIL